MKKIMCALIGALILALHYTAISQNLHNAKNVDKTVMTYYQGMQTLRVLEHTINPDPQSEKIYRLQTLSENGFSPIWLFGTDNGTTVTFEDKSPYDNMYTDNPTPYLSAEAAQLLYGFQTTMKIFDQRFSWKGLDDIGVDPLKVYIENSEETQSTDYSYAYYSGMVDNKYIVFGKSVQQNTSLFCTIDVVAHEFSHAVMKHRSN
ncbi:hypothetical protein IQ277_36300, partial [Nostocales cyanobacterium LEGE 12452]|nr:hypothetical protein [Nostocales cyanobacterium LEGE 12452]